MSNALPHEQDFYAWANEQAGLLRAGRLAEADIAQIAEEIESMGKTEKRELISRLQLLQMHLLKWQYQSGLRGTSWRLTVEEQRRQLAFHLKDNPSLKALMDEAIEVSYSFAVLAAARESGLDIAVFPTSAAWTYGQITDTGFWPGGE